MSTELLVPKVDNLVAEAAVDDEMRRAGLGFGEMLKQTGMAIAETQNKLTDTAVATTSAMATTLVDVIAVEEKQYNDQGELEESITHTRQLPLLSLIDPVFYQWSSVRLQGQMFAREFASDYSSDTFSHNSNSGYGQAGIGIVLGLGYNTYKYSSSRTEYDREETSDVSFGRMRMSSLLEPRDDVSIPKANHAIRGPRISIIVGEIQAPSPAVRTMNILLQLNRRDGSAIPGKSLSIDSGGVLWNFADISEKTTNADGQVEIVLTRTLLEGEDTPEEFIIAVRLGMVNEKQTVKF